MRGPLVLVIDIGSSSAKTALCNDLARVVLNTEVRSHHSLHADSGGAVTNSPYWLQLMADALQQSVTVLKSPEATLRGTAILALVGLGAIAALDAPPPELGETYHPNAERFKIYQKGRERQSKLYDALIGPTNATGDTA